MNNAGLVRRVLASAARTTLAAFAVITGLFTTPPAPAAPPAVKSQRSAGAHRPESGTGAHTIPFQHRTR